METKKATYYEEERLEIQSMVNPSSSKILDVGCGAGVLGSQLKSKLRAEVWGIEIINEAAVKAKQRLDKVINTSVEEAVKQLPEKYFDTIIFGDVLEHLVNPWNLLLEIKSKLKSEGEIVVSIPNVNHWYIIKKLLTCSWDYDEFGILDKTHLRFFNKASTLKMFEETGFYAVNIFENKVDYENIPDSIISACQGLGYDVDRLKQETNVFQYLIRLIDFDNIKIISKSINDIQIKINENKVEDCKLLVTEILIKMEKLRVSELGGVSIDNLRNLKENFEKLNLK